MIETLLNFSEETLKTQFSSGLFYKDSSNGSLRLEMRFRVPLPQTTTLIVYACSDSVLEINYQRQVLVDYY